VGLIEKYTTRILQDGEDTVLLLPDAVCKTLDLDIGDTMVCYLDSDDNVCLRKVDRREAMDND